MIDLHKMVVANQVLDIIYPPIQIGVKNNYINITYNDGLNTYTTRWMTKGNGLSPVFYMGCGGTTTTAISQLILWIKNKPHLPLTTWDFWCSDSCRLAKSRGEEVINLLQNAGYPQYVTCVLCKRLITEGLDWWSLKKVRGPCCTWNSGCKQK